MGVEHHFSNAKATRTLGYAPLVSSREAMARTARLYAARRGEEWWAVEPPHIAWWLAILSGLALNAGAGYGGRGPWAIFELGRSLGVLLFGSRRNIQVRRCGGAAVRLCGCAAVRLCGCAL